MYIITMMNQEPQKDYDEPEISQLKEWLSKVNGEDLAYLKGASKALLYAQENQGHILDPDNYDYAHARSE